MLMLLETNLYQIVSFSVRIGLDTALCAIYFYFALHHLSLIKILLISHQDIVCHVVFHNENIYAGVLNSAIVEFEVFGEIVHKYRKSGPGFVRGPYFAGL